MAPILLPPPVRHFMNSIQRTGPPLGYEGHQCKGGCEPPSSAWSLTKLPAIARAASSADRCTAAARSWTPRTRSPTAPNRAVPPPASQRREYSQCCGRDRSVGYGGAREDQMRVHSPAAESLAAQRWWGRARGRQGNKHLCAEERYPVQHREPAVGGRVAAHGQQVAEQNHLRTAKYSRTKSERCCCSSGTVDAESATAVWACPSTRALRLGSCTRG